MRYHWSRPILTELEGKAGTVLRVVSMLLMHCEPQRITQQLCASEASEGTCAAQPGPGQGSQLVTVRIRVSSSQGRTPGVAAWETALCACAQGLSLLWPRAWGACPDPGCALFDAFCLAKMKVS